MGKQIRVDIYDAEFRQVGPTSCWIDTWTINQSIDTLSTMDITLTDEDMRIAFRGTQLGTLVIIRGCNSTGFQSDIRDRNIEFIGVVSSISETKVLLTEFMTVFDTDIVTKPRYFPPTYPIFIKDVINDAKSFGKYDGWTPCYSNIHQMAQSEWDLSNDIVYLHDKSQVRPRVAFEDGVVNLYNVIKPYLSSGVYRLRYSVVWNTTDITKYHIKSIVLKVEKSVLHYSAYPAFIQEQNAHNFTVTGQSGGSTAAQWAGGVVVDTKATQNQYNIPEVGFATAYQGSYKDRVDANEAIESSQWYNNTPFPIRIDIATTTWDSTAKNATRPQIDQATKMRALVLAFLDPVEVSCDYDMASTSNSSTGSRSALSLGIPCTIISDDYIKTMESSQPVTQISDLPRITSFSYNSESDMAHVTMGTTRMNLIGL